MPRLIDSLSTTEALVDVFSDASLLRAMLDFEVALARVQGRLGIIPALAPAAIEKAARVESFDSAALARETLRAGTPGIPLVKALTTQVRAIDADAARFVHWGATSQDVADTAFIVVLKRSRDILQSDHTRLEKALHALSEQHQNTVMLGRTLLQPAPPVTFGLKAAGWLAAVHRGWHRISDAFDAALIVQLGSASGTLAAMGDRGIEVGRRVAADLGLGYPDAPWHSHRDRLAALVAACGIQVGSLGKMARDVALLMQAEVSEAAEPGDAQRGGSSTMPNKQNPIACSLTLAAAHRAPGLVATFLSLMVQEHERGAGGWQAEWPTVAAIIQALGLAVASMAEAAEGLTVDAARMRANIEATRGVIFAERVMMAVGASLGREEAHRLIEQAVRRSADERRRLLDILREMPEVTSNIDASVLDGMDSPEGYLGVAEALRQRLLSSD